MEKQMIVEDLEMTPNGGAGAGGVGGNSLCRSLSLRAPDPSSQLSAAYRNQDLAAFAELLTGTPPEVDPDHWYDDPNFATMLDLASRDEGRVDYVRVLLAAGADPNRVNRVRKKAPLHLAAETGNVESLGALLAEPRLDVNKQDNTGSTALHLAAREEVGQSAKARRELEHRFRKCVQMLMGHPDVNINKPNRKGLTPVHLAAQHASVDMVRLILALGGSRLDVDGYEDAAGDTARRVIADKHPQLARLLPPRADSATELTADRLFFYLYSRESTNFLQALGAASKDVDAHLLDADDGSHTLLQLACESGLNDVAATLVGGGADPNRTIPGNRRTPLYLACYHGYYRVARTLVNHERTDVSVRVNGETPLHASIKGAAEATAPALGGSGAGRDHRKCTDILLRKGVDVNATDVKGNTALHYATRNGDSDVVLSLLRSGAYVGVRNSLNEPPLADISPKALEAYLDECVVTNDLLPREDNYEVIFKYNFLAGAGSGRTAQPPAGAADQVHLTVEEDKRLVGHGAETLASETDPLLYMSRSADLRHLLKHPIITSFLYLKWQRIRTFFYVNLAFYLVFWVLLTAYVLTGYSEQPDQGTLTGPGPTGDPDPAPAQKNASAPLTSPAAPGGFGAPALAAVLAVFLLLLALRELFQLLVSPRKYVASPENWMEVCLVVVTAVLLLSRQTNSYSRQQLSAIAILLSWAELVLLIGRHPLLSTNIEMFKTVSLNFLKFLAWYSILIVAFALSFYTLFRDCGGAGCKEGEDNDENFFLSPMMSVFKSIVMLTGEFDAGSIPFVSFPGTSHVLFVLFVFLIAIVLFNLLNGLAVSDTQAIREDAELVAYVSRVNLVAYVESMLVGDPQPTKYLHNLCCCLNTCQTFGCLRTLSTRVNLFPDVVPDQQIHVLPNQSNRIEFSTLQNCTKNKDIDDDEFAGCAAKCQQIHMDRTIMRDVKALFLKRNQDNEADQMQKILEDYKKQLLFYTQRIEHLEKAEKALLDLLAKK